MSGLQHGPLHNQQPLGVPLKEKLLPEYLRERGYATHAVGQVCYSFSGALKEKEMLTKNRIISNIYSISKRCEYLYGI